MKIPLFAQVVGTVSYTSTVEIESGKLEQITWENTNKLLNKTGWYGIKTGITDSAGPCLAGCVKLYD